MTDKKVRSGSACFTLKLGNDIINDASTVSNALNEFFSTVADHIGTSSPLVRSETIDDIVKAYDTHKVLWKLGPKSTRTLASLSKKQMKTKFINY